MSFNNPNNAPTSLSNGKINTLEGCSAISTKDGKLLFYTDGMQVWNKNHTQMVNGNSLKGNYSSCQSALIIKQPNKKDSIYYIFTVDDYSLGNGFNYSIVNMNQSNSFGTVTTKNTLIDKNISEKLTATQNPNYDTYWIASYLGYKGEYRIYKLDANGINVNSYTTYQGDTTTDTRSQSKFSLNTQRYANIVRSTRNINLMDFNNTKGTLSNLISLKVPYDPYGLEFSPSGNNLYISCNRLSSSGQSDGSSLLIVFDLLAKDIQASQKVVKSIGNLSGYTSAMLGMQLATDYKIYIAINEQQYLGVIQNPDLPFDQCNFVYDGQALTKGVCLSSLPNILYPQIPYIITKNEITVCEGDSLDLNANLSQPIAATYFWVGPNNYISPDQNSKIFNMTPLQEGIYSVVATDGVGRKYNGFIKVNVIPKGDIRILNDNNFQICDNNPIILKLNKKPNNYIWSNKSKVDFISVNKAGLYSVKYWDANGSCTFTESVNVAIGTKPNVKINITQTGDDCFTIPFVLSADKDYKSYLWSNGATTKQTSIYNKGKYTLKVTNDYGCEGSDSIVINTGNKPIFSLTALPSNTFCNGESIKLDLQPKLPNSTYLWNTGEKTDYINVNKSGIFTVVVIDKTSGCKDSLVLSVTKIDAINSKILGSKYLCSNSTNKLVASLIGVGYTYLWSNGSTSNNISINSAGKYWLKTILNNNCFVYDTLDVVNENTDFDIVGQSSICNNENTVLSIDKDFKSYLWSNGAVTKSININQAGDYSCTITTINDCKKEKIFKVSNKNINSIVSVSSITFPDTRINSTNFQNIAISNKSNENISYELSNKQSKYFKLDKYIFDLLPNENKNINITFYPTNFIDYTDSLIIITKSPCVTQTVIPLYGSGIAQATLSINSLTATPSLNDFTIPINFKINDLITENFNFNLSYNIYLSELPFKSNNIIGTNSGTINIFKYKFNSIYSGNNNNKFILEKLTGNVLLADTTYYKIVVSDIISSNKNLKILSEDGSLNLIGFCNPMIRNVSNYEALNFQISPNPVSEELRINFVDEFNYKIKLELYDVIGNNVFTFVDDKISKEFKRTIRIDNINSGNYYVKVYLNEYFIQTNSITIIK